MKHLAGNFWYSVGAVYEKEKRRRRGSFWFYKYVGSVDKARKLVAAILLGGLNHGK